MNKFLISFILVLTLCVYGYGEYISPKVLFTYNAGAPTRAVASIADVNNNGYDDVLATSQDNFTVHCIDGGSTGTGNLIWSYTAGDKLHFALSVISDVNASGKDDVLVGSHDNNLYCIEGATGNVIWTYTAPINLMKGLEPINDLTGDGIDDVIFGTAEPSSGAVYCLNGANGNLLWSHTASDCIHGICQINDLNGDGKNDVVSGGRYGGIFCLTNGNILWSRDFNSVGYVDGIIQIPDVNNDGYNDVLMGSGSGGGPGTGIGKVRCLNGINGNVLWFKTLTTVGLGSPFVDIINDINGNGKIEVIVIGEPDTSDIYCLDGATGNTIWVNDELSVRHDAQTIIDDITGDGIQEIVAGIYSGLLPDYGVVCYNGANGNILWKYDHQARFLYNGRYGMISDVSGDGKPDIISGDDVNTILLLRSVNNLPIIDWAPDAGYITDGASPDSGDDGDAFVFKVNYSDADNDLPETNLLLIDLNDDGDYNDAGETIAMNEENAGDTTTTDGKIYIKSLNIANAGDDTLNYEFSFSDVNGGATGNATAAKQIIVSPLGNSTVINNMFDPDGENAAIDIDPDTLNIGSEGIPITCYIELPVGYNVNNIDISTVAITKIQDSAITPIYAVSTPTEIGDYDSDGINDLMVKFSRDAVSQAVSIGDIKITVTGKLSDGSDFLGSATIRVIDTPLGKQKAKVLKNKIKTSKGEKATIIYTLEENAEVKIRILNINGEVMVEFDSAVLVPGEYIKEWDGKDDEGKTVKTGAYIAEIDINGKIERYNIVVAK